MADPVQHQNAIEIAGSVITTVPHYIDKIGARANFMLMIADNAKRLLQHKPQPTNQEATP